MRALPRVFLAVSAIVGLGLATRVPPAFAAANHVVISEFATRGPTAATDEFVEQYNPTSSAIDLSGWRMQYKPATSTTWSDRAILPANSTIPAHGFFRIANTSYIGTVVPDYTSSLWTYGQGMADSGHERILDASLVQIDKVGFGTSAIDPEGSPRSEENTSELQSHVNLVCRL